MSNMGLENNDINSYTTYRSKKIPGLEARLYEDGQVFIEVNGIDFTIVGDNASGIVINRDKDTFVRLVEKAPTVEGRIMLALAECENYLEKNGIDSLYQASKFVQSIQPQLTDSCLYAGLVQHGNNDVLPHINVPLALTDEGKIEVLGMTDFKALEGMSDDMALKKFKISVYATCYLPEDPSKEFGEVDLYVSIHDAHSGYRMLHEQRVKLPQDDQEEINRMVVYYLNSKHMDPSMEKFIASRFASNFSAVHPKSINKLQKSSDGKKLYGEIEFFDDPKTLLFYRSNAVRATGCKDYEEFKKKGIPIRFRIIFAEGEDKLYHCRIYCLGHKFSTKAAIPLRDDDVANIFETLEKNYGPIEQIMKDSRPPKQINSDNDKKTKVSPYMKKV